jgi:hypothetical protein
VAGGGGVVGGSSCIGVPCTPTSSTTASSTV